MDFNLSVPAKRHSNNWDHWDCIYMCLCVCLCVSEIMSTWVQRCSWGPKYVVAHLWNTCTHTSACACVYCYHHILYYRKHTWFADTGNVFDVMQASCPFLVLHMVIYKADIPYLIWAGPDMEPSIWWLCKYFQCSSHNGHWELCEDQRPHLCHGICRRNGCSQVGVRAFVEALLEKSVGDGGSPTKTSCHPIILIPPSSYSPSLGLQLSYLQACFQLKQGGVILRSSMQCLATRLLISLWL